MRQGAGFSEIVRIVRPAMVPKHVAMTAAVAVQCSLCYLAELIALSASLGSQQLSVRLLPSSEPVVHHTDG